MIESTRAVAGGAILSGVTTIDCTKNDRTKVEPSVGQDGRDEVLEDLVRQHARLVYRIAYAVLRRHHDAEDAAQETFVRVLRYRAKLDSVHDAKSWLARIAWRVAVEKGRRHQEQREIPLDDPEKPLAEFASSDAAADEALRGAQVSAALEKLIAALPRKLREPLILSTVEELSPLNVAQALRINEAAVRSRVFRARRILREKLDQSVGKK